MEDIRVYIAPCINPGWILVTQRVSNNELGACCVRNSQLVLFGSLKDVSMNEEQTATTQPEILSPIIEWGPWPLWILVGVTVGNSITIYFSLLQGIILGGAIGGVIVGFMPYFAKQWQISKARWWLWTLVNSTLIVTFLLICMYYLYLEAQSAQINLEEYGIHSTTIQSQFESRLVFLFIIIVLGTITGMIVAAITRWVCRRWQNSQASWWVWIVAGTLIVISMFIPLYLMALMFAQ